MDRRGSAVVALTVVTASAVGNDLIPFSTTVSFGCSVAANVTRCLVETILAMSYATRLQNLMLKKRECRDETRKRGAKRQVRQVRL